MMAYCGFLLASWLPNSTLHPTARLRLAVGERAAR
jgi:hypothetical protein